MQCRAGQILFVLVASVFLNSYVRGDEPPKPPKVGDTFKEYKFDAKTDHEVSFASLAKKGPLVVVVLRGYPGYQCPACTAQVGEFRQQAVEFKNLGANVVLVYPGSVDNLQLRAKQFLKNERLPEPLTLVLDPKYDFISSIGLRWDKQGETAYPSTFVLGKDRVVKFAKISKSHGDRAKAKDVVAALQKLNGMKERDTSESR